MATLVRHAMTQAPTTLSPDSTAGDAAIAMANHDIGAVPVVEDGRLVGLVTDRDLVTRALATARDPRSVKLSDVLTGSPVSASPGMTLDDARDLMAQHQIRRLPVVQGDELVGIISIGDVALQSASKREVGETLEEVSRSASTEELNDGPDRGTPDRVRERS
jgi:CBS domain-containing protein